MDQIARHRVRQTLPADHHVHVASAVREKDSRLSGGVAAADDDHFFCLAELRFDRRGSVIDAISLET